MRIAVAGGTGVVGRRVVDRLSTAGHRPVVLSRSLGVDLVTGHGLPTALENVEVVIDVAAPSALSAKRSIEFFGTTTRNLLAAERATGVRHHVALSIVGAASVDAGYYAGKAEQERLVMGSGDGWSILRSTQFFEFVEQTISRGTVAGVVVSPRFRCQPVAAADVAGALVAIAAGPARGLVTDLAGPREEYLPELVRRYLRAMGRSNPVVAVTLPGAMGAAMRGGALLPVRGYTVGEQNFAQWLEHVVRASEEGLTTE